MARQPRKRPSPPARTSRLLAFKAKRGATSNYYLAKLIRKGSSNLTPDERRDLVVLIRDTHRITPVAQSKAKSGKSVFNATTGHHEWLPTDLAPSMIDTTPTWRGLFTSLRSPTWLLVVNPARYCTDLDAYSKGLQAAANCATSGNGQTVLASSLGLVGHSGGLNRSGTQLTQFQSTWHDELRALYNRHASTNAYDAYWNDLCDFIRNTFLFVDAPALPLGNTVLGTATHDDVLRSIAWDLSLSGRGNPTDAPMATLYDVAQYLHRQWANGWWPFLANSFRAWNGSSNG